MENTQVMSPEELQRRQERAQRMDSRAGVQQMTFESMKVLKVYNPSETASELGATIGDFVGSIKTENGYLNSIEQRPMMGVILKVRWYLKSKWKFQNTKENPNGHTFISNEFDNFSPSQFIIVKEIIRDGDKTTFTPVFSGNYAQIGEKYALKDEDGTIVEKKLDLNVALYVVTDIKNEEIVKVDFKGMSRSNFFYFMKTFNKREGESLTQMNTLFDSKINTHNSTGKLMQSPVAAFTFTKGMFVSESELDSLEELQVKFEEELAKRSSLFGDAPKEKISPVDDTQQLGYRSEQPSPTEELPTINLDDEKELEELDF